MTPLFNRSALSLLSALLSLPVTLAAQEPPGNVAATAGRGSVTVSWTGIRGQVGYRVLRATDARSQGQELTRPLGQGVTSFVDVTAVPGTTYFYQVIAVYGDRSEGASVPIQFPAPGTAAPAPTALGPVAGRLAPMPGPVGVKVTGSPIAATVFWQHPGAGVGSYVVSRLENNVPVKQVTLAANQTSWSDVGLRPLTSYTYYVKAIYPPDGREGSAQMSFTTPGPVNPNPGNSYALAAGVGKVKLQWPPVADVSYYVVFGQGSSQGGVVVPAPANSNPVTYMVTGAPAGPQTWSVGSYYDPGPNSAAVPVSPNAVYTPTAQFTKMSMTVSAAPVVTARRTNFDPALHGFKFTNDFKNSFIGHPVNMQTGGLCGGMSYTVLDYYHNYNSGIRTPSQKYRPANNTLIQQYLYGRQVTSLLSNLDKWGEISLNPGGARNVEFFNWGLTGRLQELRAFIDRGVPVPLSFKGTGIGHQVVAIGYDAGRYEGDIVNYANVGDLKIFIFDPNHPGRTMTLVPDLAAKEFYYLEATSDRWRTYFVDGKYIAQMPPNIVYPVYPTNGMIYELRFEFTTGADDMRGGADHVDVTVNLKDGTSQLYPNISHDGVWLPQYEEIAQVILVQPVQLANIKSFTITTNSGGMNADNWNLSVLRVTAVGGGPTRSLQIAPWGPFVFTAARIPVVVNVQ